tara:strand:- start:433 stop:756 length:324 start_codon:yes stop_codon:yes gene_type:complete
MSHNPDFCEKLSEVERSLEAFLSDFNAGKVSDFSILYDQVYTLLQNTDKEKLAEQDLEHLKKLGNHLEEITSRVQQEMRTLQKDISKNNHHRKGLQAYARQTFTRGD